MRFFFGYCTAKNRFLSFRLQRQLAALGAYRGLAAACFTEGLRDYVFLGGPRSPGHDGAKPRASPLMTVPMIICASLCWHHRPGGTAGRRAGPRSVVVSVFEDKVHSD